MPVGWRACSSFKSGGKPCTVMVRGKPPHSKCGENPVGFQLRSPMTETRPVRVAAGVLVDGDRILICQRHRSDAYGLEWEFPGGKVRKGEGLKECLRRELAEELSIDADIGAEVHRLRHRYPDRPACAEASAGRFVEVVFFLVSGYRGEVENRVFEAVEWTPRSELTRYQFLEADRKLVERIARGEIV